MADDDVVEDLDDLDPNDPEGWKKLRAAAARGTKAIAREKELEKVLAVERAGIDTSTRKGAAWMNQYDGKLDPEAMLADATDFDPSIIKASASTAPAEPVADPAAPAAGAEDEAGETVVTGTGTDARTALADGAIPAGAATQSPTEAALAAGRAAIEDGGTEEIGIGEFIAHKALSAHQGVPTGIDSYGRRVQPV